MGDNSASLAEPERKIGYLSAQVERLVSLQNPFPSSFVEFAEVCNLGCLDFQARSTGPQASGGAVNAHNNGHEIDINEGLLFFLTKL